jgi:preprotein translocase subunit SecY
MGFEQAYTEILKKIPGIVEPLKKLTFKEKFKWTAIVLLIYFLMTQITVYGVSKVGFEQFKMLQILLGSSFGSLMTLGIGPIVTASILLQLLVGSKLIPWDLKSDRGRSLFQGTQKLLAMVLSFVEATVFVSMGAVPTLPGAGLLVIIQIAIGGILVIFMDEMISKWGFGSGVSLFIAAGVSKEIFIGIFNPLTESGTFPTAGSPPVGRIPLAITLLGANEPFQAFIAFLPVIATALVFLLVIYANALKVEIPLAFGSIRGFGRRWPLRFFYTSNLPVILIAALLANIQLMSRMLAQGSGSFLGTFDSAGNPTGGLIYFLIPPSTATASGLMIAQLMIFIGVFVLIGAALAYMTKKNALKMIIGFGALGVLASIFFTSSMGITSLTAIGLADIARIVCYSLFLIIGSMIFSIFWMTTSGMDPKSVAEQIQSTGMQIPGYRRDIRIIERVLDRYIPALAVLGGAAVGALAAYADLTSAIGTGTGILLATMIIYNLYEEIAMQHMEDMHPAIRKLME